VLLSVSYIQFFHICNTPGVYDPVMVVKRSRRFANLNFSSKIDRAAVRVVNCQ
jgi:hypothetical protein